MYARVISRVSALVALLAVAGLGCGGCENEGDVDGLTPKASGVSPLDPVAADASAPRYLSTATAQLDNGPGEAAVAPKVSDKDAKIGLRWTFSPPQLRVYRATQVAFRLDQAPRGHEAASCSWNFGDGRTAEGCNVTHTFKGGLADELVTLTLTDGDWEYRSQRSVPLERLEVVPGLLDGKDPLASARGIPERPTPADRTFRFAVVADTAASGGVPQSVVKAVDALKTKVKPELVIHAGGIGDSSIIARGLTSAGAKVAFGQGPSDRDASAGLKAPGIQLLEGSDYPRRYTFTHKGVFFMVISTDAAQGGESVSEETMKWMRKQLGKARIYEARYVVSYLPIRKYAEQHVGTLDKNFRLYELFLRGRVTAFFSGAYRVFYKGTYGALDVVSVGSLAGPGGRLLGTDFQQPASFVAVDVVKGAPKQTFAVEGPEFDRTADETLLPKTVGMYSLGR